MDFSTIKIDLAILLVKINYWLRKNKMLPDKWFCFDVWMMKKGVFVK